MDGKGRCLDNVFVERLLRSVKQECIYIHRYETVPELRAGLVGYFRFYNEERLHQSLSYRTPVAVYRQPRRAAGGGKANGGSAPEPPGFSQAWLWCPTGYEEGPRANRVVGGPRGFAVGAPSAGLSLGRVASPQSPPPFHPARPLYSGVAQRGKVIR